MTTTKTDRSMLQISRTINAPVARVWKAWTEPGQIAKWFGCADVRNLQIEQDTRVGGEYRYSLTNAEGETIVASGVFKEVVAGKKLVYTWNNSSSKHPAVDTEVTVEFTAVGGSTEISLTHRNFAIAASAEGHTIGWTGVFDKFGTFVEQ